MYTSLLSIHFSAKRLFLLWKTVSPCFNLAWVTAKGSDFQFFLTGVAFWLGISLALDTFGGEATCSSPDVVAV